MRTNAIRLKKYAYARTLNKAAVFIFLCLVISITLAITDSLTYVLADTHNGDGRSNFNSRGDGRGGGNNEAEPSLSIGIDGDGAVTYRGDLVDSMLFCPDSKEYGTIRIHNEFSKIKISSISAKAAVTACRARYDKDEVKDSFLQNMKLTIIDQNAQTLISDVPLGSLHYAGQLYLEKDQTLDLYYTLEMDSGAGNELQGVTADFSLLINVEQCE